MQYGQPYKLGENGEKKTPNPTTFGAVIDEKVKLEDKSWAKLQEDVPGDKGLRETWDEAIKKVNPHGIIYMIDGRLNEKDLQSKVREMYEDVLKEYQGALGNLATFHIFVSFSDVWMDSEVKARQKARFVEQEADKLILENPLFESLVIQTHVIQLSPNKKSWDKADKAITKFGTDLKDT